MNIRKCRVISLLGLAACFAGSTLSAQTIYNQPLVKEFDTNGNVTGSATGSPNDKATFSAAMPNNFGGMFDIASAHTFTNGTTIFRGTYGAENPKFVDLTFTRSMQVFSNGATYAPSSGTRGVTTQSTAGNYGFTISTIKDGNDPTIVIPDFNVSRIGFAVMSRTNAAGETVFPCDVKVIVNYSTGASESVTSPISGTKGQNTFFGFTAPAGASIVGVNFEAYQSNTTIPVSARIGLDDIGVIITNTGAVVAPPVISSITPENSYLGAGMPFTFGATSTEDITVAGIDVLLNGVSANNQLMISGDSLSSIVSITGLVPETAYQAAVTITNGTGTTSRTFNFTTKEPAPTITEITSNGSYLTPAMAFQFGASSLILPLNAGNFDLTLNGVGANGQLSLGGTPTKRVVSITGLQANRTYLASVTAFLDAGRTTTRTFNFHTQGEPVFLSNTGGFENGTLYPPGVLPLFTDGFTRWAPQVGTLQAAIVDSGNPTYGKVYRRQQGGADDQRTDYLYFPPVNSGVLTLSFDARMSATDHRILDISFMRGGTDLTFQAGFLQFGRVSGRITYFNNTSYIEIPNFDLDTAWHRYEMIHYFSGPFAKTFDLKVDGVVIATHLPWRKAYSEPIERVRIQTIGRDVPLPDGASQDYADLDNIRIRLEPFKPTAIAAPVTTTQLGKGVVYRKYTHSDLYASKQVVHVTDINLNDPSVALKFPYTSGVLRTVPAHAAGVSGAVAAVNGQFFVGTGSIQHFKVGGTLVNPTNNASDQQAITDDGLGTPNSVRMVNRPAAGWESLATANIVASGPYLFLDGAKWTAYDPADTTFVPVRFPRTAAALTYDNHLLLVVVDGANSAVSAGMTIPELQDYINTLGWVRSSTNYDGGGSATMWTNGTVVNVPSDGTPRPVANAIAVTAASVTIPGQPSGVAAVAAEQGYALQWQLVSGATSYEVRRATAAGGPYTVVGNPENPYFTDTTAVAGTAYFYVIVAKSSAGSGTASAVLATGSSDAVVAPAVAFQKSGTGYDLIFNTVNGRTYQLQRSITMLSDGWENVGAAKGGTGSPITIPVVPSGPVGFYRILVE